jgi:lysine-ketoglutarate reductase/saccharopine dehydrogenase-like protein (TIGR00300 family)
LDIDGISTLPTAPGSRIAVGQWPRLARGAKLKVVTTFSPPDFSDAKFAAFPDATFVPAPADGVLPEGFFSTTNLPTFVRVNGRWIAPREPRMDSGLVLERDGSVWVREGRRIMKGDLVAVGEREDGANGIFVQTHLVPHGADPDAFTFMSSEVSREKPIDYAHMARLLIEEKERGGYPIWVTGPALVHSRARADMTWFITNGYVGALLAGNAVAVHDIEASIYGTTLGMTNTGEITRGGHGLHMRAINRVRAAGSIANAVEQGIITDGIMFACVKQNIPFVLTGSIRDDGPLPDVITDSVVAQDAMRAHAKKATFAVLIATALHAIATGNMLPAFVQRSDGQMRELTTICVDSSEFVVSKLKDRGTHQAFGVVTNAQDFMHILRLYVERELESRALAARATTATTATTAATATTTVSA